MSLRHIMYISALAALLCGCAGQHDPREGGFFGGVAGLGGGGYKQRVAERESRLEELRATQNRLDAEKAQLEGQKSTLQVQVAQDREQVRAMQADIAALEKKTTTLSARQGTDQKRVADLQKRIKTLKTQATQQSSALDALEGRGQGDSDADLRRKQLEAQRDALRKEYDLLMKMQMELAQ